MLNTVLQLEASDFLIQENIAPSECGWRKKTKIASGGTIKTLLIERVQKSEDKSPLSTM